MTRSYINGVGNMDIARAIGIWVSGTLGCGLAGLGVAMVFDRLLGLTGQVAFPVALGSALLFVCFRLWRVEIRNSR